MKLYEDRRHQTRVVKPCFRVRKEAFLPEMREKAFRRKMRKNRRFCLKRGKKL